MSWLVFMFFLKDSFSAKWCYHYCTTSFNKAWTQVLCKFEFCLRHVRDSQWWGSLTRVPAGNKAKRLSLVNHTTKTNHHHHLHYQLKKEYAFAVHFLYRFIKSWKSASNKWLNVICLKLHFFRIFLIVHRS